MPAFRSSTPGTNLPREEARALRLIRCRALVSEQFRPAPRPRGGLVPGVEDRKAGIGVQARRREQSGPHIAGEERVAARGALGLEERVDREAARPLEPELVPRAREPLEQRG